MWRTGPRGSATKRTTTAGCGDRDSQIERLHLALAKESGTQPYTTGRGEEVVELRWREGASLARRAAGSTSTSTLEKKPRANSRSDSAADFFPSGCTRQPRRKPTAFISR